MNLRLYIVGVIVALPAMLAALLCSSCGEVSLNDPMLGKELTHTIFYVKWNPDLGKPGFIISQVVRINADGTGRMVIADTATITSAPHNGKVVYLTEVPDKKDLRIVILCDADGSNKVIIDTGEYIGAELSPSGDFVLLTTDHFGGKPAELYRVSISGSTVSDTVRYKGVKLEHDILPALSPDGNLIAFVGDNSGGGKEVLFIIHSDGSGTPKSLGEVDILPGERLTWSSDSKRILCHGDQSRKYITISSTDGSRNPISFPPNLKPEEASFGTEPETFLVTATLTPSKAINLYEVKQTGAFSTIRSYSTPNWSVKIGGYSSDTTLIVYSAGDNNQFTKTMNVYDRLSAKDTTLDMGVTQCFFAK